MNVDEHRWMREQLGAFALKQLDPRERIAVQAHVDGCRGCRGELASIAPLADVLKRADPDRLQVVPAPPPDFGSQVLHRVMVEDRGVDLPRRRAPSRWVGNLLIAAVVGAVGIGAGWWISQPPDQPLEPVPLALSSPQVKATANIVPHPWGMEIKLTGANFPDGQVFRAVVIDQAGKRVNAGEFVGNGGAEINCNLNSSVLRQQATGFEIRDQQDAVILKSNLS